MCLRISKIICSDLHPLRPVINVPNTLARRHLISVKISKNITKIVTRKSLSKMRKLCAIHAVITTIPKRCCNRMVNSMGTEFEVSGEVGRSCRETNKELMPLYPPGEYKDVVMLFFKLFDRGKEDLRYVGRLFAEEISKPTEILGKLNEMAGYASDQEIELYEVVHFQSFDKPKEQGFCLGLCRVSTYDDVVGRIARQLELDGPSKIRLTCHNCYSQQPKPPPIKYHGVDNLVNMLVHYYEVVIHTMRLPKQSTVIYVIRNLKTKVELSHPDEELRLLEVFYHKIYKIFPTTEKIENINDQYWILRAEEIPEEEKNLGPRDGLIHVYHFNKEAAQNQTWKLAFLSLGCPEYLEDLDILSSRFQQRDVCGAWEQYLGLDLSDGAPKRTHAAHQIRQSHEKL